MSMANKISNILNSNNIGNFVCVNSVNLTNEKESVFRLEHIFDREGVFHIRLFCVALASYDFKGSEHTRNFLEKFVVDDLYVESPKAVILDQFNDSPASVAPILIDIISTRKMFGREIPDNVIFVIK